ncbi:hypothetical protein RV11_GL001872 [Enterococcus phoeniculicola]|uniref:Uncharacterized protein n=1 Tax=Enterococcus phoeniculicola ATCC BAA-412 TaxID=1158610 RepID=R3W3U6_9ENTE|nr:hypothetical protein [Enterococcus phoeniculicola]EOL42322.1 hypothetical protein UC3_02674 [Enterococcus phoeniculicola ATCC BAA-412]EOT79399.1 hypothetical protein I589_00907 [Enterococcus phoeniculicola ATCC BAA-412]OJG73062.1 hypothetical protein RV11_GL001872 [Enterococcus phoeniculicola]
MIYLFLFTFVLTQFLLKLSALEKISFKQIFFIGTPCMFVLSFLFAFLHADFLLVITVTFWGTILTNKSRRMFGTV